MRLRRFKSGSSLSGWSCVTTGVAGRIHFRSEFYSSFGGGAGMIIDLHEDINMDRILERECTTPTSIGASSRRRRNERKITRGRRKAMCTAVLNSPQSFLSLGEGTVWSNRR